MVFIKIIWIKFVFKHDMAYGKYKYLSKRTESDKLSRGKTF